MHPSARTLGTDFDLFLGLEPQHSLFVVFFFFLKIPRLFSQAAMAKNHWFPAKVHFNR